jgi:hypothetical protein
MCDSHLSSTDVHDIKPAGKNSAKYVKIKIKHSLEARITSFINRTI